MVLEKDPYTAGVCGRSTLVISGSDQVTLAERKGQWLSASPGQVS